MIDLGNRCIADDGTVVLTAPAATAGRVTYTAIATQSDATTVRPLVVRSVNTLLLVHNGSAIAVTPSTKPVSGMGPSPLNATVLLTLQDVGQMLDVGTVAYFVSDNGTDFTPLLSATGTSVAGARLLSTVERLTGNVKHYYKATVANKWSNQVTESAVVSAEAFHLPVASIRMPKLTVVEHPVTMTAVSAEPGVTLEQRWTVKLGTTTETSTEPSFTFTPHSVGVMSVTLATRDAAGLDTPAAWKTVLGTVSVLPPAVPAPLVTGPTIVEVGQSYTWNAVQRSPFAANSGTDLVLSSQWVLPDGSNTTENPATYTLKPGDAAVIRYETWIEGFPASKVGTNLALRPWAYVWPAWKMSAAVVTPYAPAKVTFAASLVTPSQIIAMHGEPLTYTWTFPQGVTVVSQTDGLATVEFPTAGTYRVSALISDTRGNGSTVTSQDVTIQPPKPLSFSLALSVGDRWNRPPGPVLAKATSTSLPSGDRVAGTTFFVNNEQVGSEVLSGAATLNLPLPGSYDIKAVMRSANGVTAEATQAVTLTLGDLPACVLKKVGNGVSALAFSPNCSVQRGLVVRYQWIVNEDTAHPSQVTANSISFSASLISGIHTVRVVATTDRGQIGGAIFDLATGVSTPSP